MPVKPVPDGYHAVTPYLVVQQAARLIDFLKQAFGAREIERTTMPDGRIMNAVVEIGDSRVMLGEAPEGRAPFPAMLYLYLPDVDAAYARAIAAGGSSVMEPVDQLYGDRSGAVRDHSGNEWWIATHIEDVAPEEIARRAAVARG